MSLPPVYHIRFTKNSAEQLRDIFHYIEKNSEENAGRMIGRIIKAIDALDQFPHRYRVLKDARPFGAQVRSMPVPPYLVRYHVDDQRLCVTVLSVWHGARRPGI